MVTFDEIGYLGKQRNRILTLRAVSKVRGTGGDADDRKAKRAFNPAFGVGGFAPLDFSSEEAAHPLR